MNNETPKSGIKLYGLIGYSNILARIKFYSPRIQMQPELLNVSYRQTIRSKVQYTRRSHVKTISMKTITAILLSCMTIIPCISQTAEDYFKSGNDKFELKDYRGAINDHTQAIKLNSNVAGPYFNRGIAKYAIKDYNGAITDFNKGLEISPIADGYYNRGSIKIDLNDNTGAISDFNKAIEIDPNQKFYYQNRGIAKGNLKDFRGAIKDFDKAIALDPKFALAYAKRGLAKIALGQKDSGCLDLSKAGELGITDAYDMISKYCQ